MIVPAIGGLVGELSAAGHAAPLGQGEPLAGAARARALTEAAGAGSLAGPSGAGSLAGPSGAGSLAGASGVGSLTGASGTESLAGAAGTGPEGGFSSALTNAISSLEQSQQSSDSAAQALATGTVSDPQSAIVTVQDAQLEMQLASQIRTKATEAIQSVFQTQV